MRGWAIGGDGPARAYRIQIYSDLILRRPRASEGLEG